MKSGGNLFASLALNDDSFDLVYSYDAFCRRHHLPPIEYQQLNRWSLTRYGARPH